MMDLFWGRIELKYNPLVGPITLTDVNRAFQISKFPKPASRIYRSKKLFSSTLLDCLNKTRWIEIQCVFHFRWGGRT